MNDAKKDPYSISSCQGGFVRRDQLAFPPSKIKSQLRSRHLIRVYKNVYAVGHVPTAPGALGWAAILAVGDESALSGRSAASFYGVLKGWREPLEVMTPKRRVIQGITITRVTTLATRDIWRHSGLRVTSPARTALDLAPTLSAKRLHSGVDHLRLRHHLSLHLLHDIVDRNPEHPGAGPLGALIGHLPPNAQRSDFEREFRAFAERFDLPPCEFNAHVGGHEVDVLVNGKVIVELDTFKTHVLNFSSDRERDAEILARTGIPTIRLTDAQFHDEPEVSAERIRQAAK